MQENGKVNLFGKPLIPVGDLEQGRDLLNQTAEFPF